MVGVPVMPPEPTLWVNNLRPGGICPETTLNWTGFSDVRQPVVEKNHVFSVPTLPSAKVSGTMAQVLGGGLLERQSSSRTQCLNGTTLRRKNGENPPSAWLSRTEFTRRRYYSTGALGGGGDVELTVQPDRRAVAAVADPSLTSTVQSEGAVKPLLSILKRPEPSLVPMATPSTVMVRLGLAWPSILSCVPLSSAREMLTAACAAEGTTSVPIRTSAPTSARRA